MIYKVFAIKDKALDSYSAPYTQATMESGLRMFRDIVVFGEKDNMYRRSPEDYSLVMLGQYDDDTGEMIPEKPVTVSTVTEILSEQTTAGE